MSRPTTAAVLVFSLLLANACVPPAETSVPTALRDADGAEVTELLVGEGRRETLFSDVVVQDVSIDADGWTVGADGDAVTVRADYGADEAATLRVELGEHTALVTLGLRAIAWRELPTWAAGEGPAGREYFPFWVDPTDADTAWVFGGFQYEPTQFTPSNDLWRLDLTTDRWTHVEVDESAPARGGASLAVGPEGVLLYGGMSGDPVDGFSLPFTLREWSTSGPTWSERSPDGAPSVGRYQPAFFWVDALGAYVAVAGNELSGPSNSAEMFDPGTGAWSSLAIDGLEKPAPRAGFFWTYQPSAERLVMFGGELGAARADDTWALRFDGGHPRWERLDLEGDAPGPRRNGLYAYDPVGERLFVFGGTADGAYAAEGLWALDLTPGEERWSLVRETSSPGGPAPRSSGAAVYDAARDRVVLGFGNSELGVYEDLWALEL